MMAQQVPVPPGGRVAEDVDAEGVREVTPDLAYQRHVLVNVLYWGAPDCGDRGWVLIDAGIFGSHGTIVDAAAGRFGSGVRPRAIVLTHGHFDHVGALETLAEAWDAPIWAHPLERPYLDGTTSYPPPDPSAGGGLLARLSPLYPRGPVDVGSRLRDLPPDGSVPPMPGWRWIHVPGHAPGQVALWREADRTLIAGDAFVTTAQESVYAVATQATEIHGPPRYFTPDWGAARTSVETLAALEPDLAITGHGRALGGPLLRSSLHRLASEFDKLAVPHRGP